jgi:hypothetical protein
MQEIIPQQLDEASFEYLTQIDRSSGAEGTGVFIRRSGRRSDPRDVQRLTVWLGVLLVGLAVAGCALRSLKGSDFLGGRHLQVAVLALGAGLLVRGRQALRRPTSRPPLGEFYWADSLHFWEVSPECVRSLPLDRVREAQGAVGGYSEHILGLPIPDAPLFNTFTAITLDVSAGSPVYFTVYEQEAAERLIHFINAVVCLRQSEPVAADTEDVPDWLGRAAVELSQGASGPSTEAGDVPQRPRLPPRPHPVEPIAQATRPAGWERLAPWLVAALVGALGAVGMP